ncbi:hypothetical protein HYV89_00315 [Candidatus Woesearchaeota archaeon]|nr:hypothetical protein [Candidatus Woesearchaeota archaeon]
MQPERITALSTAIIAFVTIIGLMFGFYYNLKLSGFESREIFLFEIIFIVSVWIFLIWLRRKIKNE